METVIHQEFLTENHYIKIIGSTKVELHFRFKPFNVLKDNGLPCISHLQVSCINQVTGKKNGKSHYFHPESLYGYTCFEEFAEDAIKHFIKEEYIVIDTEVQYSLF
ncbi:hypothetical protein SAMN05421827_12825 [Pedobacter terrae]|uniref:Uncharacterized protein n=1 Tax=Pedobacter terrae TaxID=405671 RepID=A0A1G8D699_9SPHI|nr:hypothetical protein [Pedobacter terrae]SDH53305.1 hypothetical protein SAMN05421827_12825 [Pedobacter terrae]